MSLRVFLLIKDNNEPCFFIAFSYAFIFPMTVNSDERIYGTKNICGRYYAAEINGVDAARSLGLRDSGRVGSRVEQYCNFFR